MEVKQWKPQEGCKSCADAKRIMSDMTRISADNHSKALSKIREQASKIVELESQEEVTRVCFGDMSVMKLSEERWFISDENGEGMEISERAIEKMLQRYKQDNF